MKVLLLLDGECPDPGLARRVAAACSFVVAADGGARHAAALGLKPRFIVGDMDSLPRRLPRWEGTTYLCDFDENASDFEKALRFLSDAEELDLYVAGAFGGRPDHVLVNLALAQRWSKSMPITLLDRGLARLAGPGRHPLSCRPGQTVSLIACPPGAVVSTRGLRYALNRQRLEPGGRGLSNQAAAAKAEITLHRGKAWLVLPAA